MEILRLNTYEDERFSQRALLQHGCFLLDGAPCEVEIVSDHEAVVRGGAAAAYPELLEEFRFFAPHITRFLDEKGELIRAYPRARLLWVELAEIQPSQFFVDRDKLAAIGTFIEKPEDIVIQVLPHEGRYIALDGHTRLYYAVEKGWERVRAVVETSDDWVYGFVEEANKRGIFAPKDMEPVSHGEYGEKWDRFCDAFFEKAEVGEA